MRLTVDPTRTGPIDPDGTVEVAFESAKTDLSMSWIAKASSPTSGPPPRPMQSMLSDRDRALRWIDKTAGATFEPLVERSGSTVRFANRFRAGATFQERCWPVSFIGCFANHQETWSS